MSVIRFARPALGFVALILSALIPSGAYLAPSIYATGTTIYMPDKAWSGYTLFDTGNSNGAMLIDMNGNELRHFPEIDAVPGPARIFPGGYVMGGNTARLPHQESVALIQMDWEGNVVWRFDRTEEVMTEDGDMIWAARQHHDWQREGSPAGYFAPGSAPLVDRGRTLILAHKNVTDPDVAGKRLEDDYILEVSWDGEVLWEWLASDHVEEFGFSGDARNAIYRASNFNEARQSFDWLHINAATYVGPNHWYDEGDERFHPDNVIFSSRASNVIGIVARSGDIVWRLGPDYRQTAAQREIGQIIGQHHAHFIPVGLPGAGNLLVFDNGGAAGYGAGTPEAPDGWNVVTRFRSRVLEIDPVTLEVVWEYSVPGQEGFRFFSSYVSAAQRLPNGNTVITEGADGRLFEVTADGEIVWEYVNAYPQDEPQGRTSRIFRSYRVPYDWIPQLARPTERPVIPPDVTELRIAPQ